MTQNDIQQSIQHNSVCNTYGLNIVRGRSVVICKHNSQTVTRNKWQSVTQRSHSKTMKLESIHRQHTSTCTDNS